MSMYIYLMSMMLLLSSNILMMMVRAEYFQLSNETMNGTMKVENIFIDITYGQNVFDSLSTQCYELFTEIDDCYLAMDYISFTLYKMKYTPSRITSELQDYLTFRWDILNYLIKRYSYSRYLEIGCAEDKTFNSIKPMVSYSIGVDPMRGGTHRMTSDAFFQQNNEMFDLIFIDGDHNAYQVLRDIQNSLRFLSYNGSIVLHDCNPRHRDYQIVPKLEYITTYTGDVWKAITYLRLQDGLEVITIDVDNGVSVIRRKHNQHRLPMPMEYLLLESSLSAFSYDDLSKHRDIMLRLSSLIEFESWLNTDNDNIDGIKQSIGS